MDFAPLSPAVHVTRIAELHWHALEDDEVIGRGHAARRPDGRLFLSIDAWHDTVFDRLAEAMLADLPRPLHTLVDEADDELICRWERARFAPRRREWEYVLPTAPYVVRPPAGVTILPPGQAQLAPLQTLDRVIRAEVEAGVGWAEMPAELLPGPLDPARYAVAAGHGEYLGLLRVVPLPRQPRIGLLAVRADHRRRGIAKALLAEFLNSVHRRGIATASADIQQSNVAATALFEDFGARRVSSNLELLLR